MALTSGCLKKETGAQLIETALALPVILILLMGVVDIGRWLNSYYAVSRVAYESARYAASLAGLEEGENRYGDHAATIQGQVRVRTRDLLELYGLDPEQGHLDINYTAASLANSVAVTVQMPFEPMFPLMSFMQRVRGEANAPYLFPRRGNIFWNRSTQSFEQRS